MACVWCGAGFDDASERRPQLVGCRSCGAFTTTPWPSDEVLDEAYGAWYRPSSGRFGRIGDAVLRRSRAALAARLDGLAPAGSILDVGSGDGALLDALAGAGRSVTGLERRPSGGRVLAADIADVEGRWAAAVFWHSLEHLRAPGAAVRHAAALLVPGGLLVIAVPNVDSLQATLFGDRWFALDVPRHLVHLPAGAVLDAVRAQGLHVERVSYLRGGQVVFGWLHGLVGSLPGQPDLYDAIRQPPARRAALSAVARLSTLAAGTVLLPAAVVAALVEVALGRGGTLYVEARRV